MSEKLYSTNEAADYLGLHPMVLRYHLDKKHLAVDEIVGGNYVFRQSTLDTFRATHQAEGYTLDEAAAYLDVDRSWVHNQFHRTKKLQAIGKRGKFWVFSQESLDALRPLVEEQRGRVKSATRKG